MARGAALAAAVAVALLAVSGAGGAGAQTPKRGGTITISRPVFTEPACLNPFACSVLWFDAAVLQVLEGAYELDARLDVRPNLVTHVETSRRPFTLTYHIRREARWSDGVPVTASDFLFTQRAFATIAAPAAPWLGEEHRKVRRFRVLDAKTFRLELREPFANWRNLYPVVLPRHALAGRDLRKVWIDRIDDPRTGRPIGSGPFLYPSWERGQQHTLVRNAHYWGEHTAYLDRLVYRFTRPEPSDPVGPLRRDEVDMATQPHGVHLARAGAADTADTGLAGPDGAGDAHGASGLPGRRRRPPCARESARPPCHRLRHRSGSDHPRDPGRARSLRP